jgi:hypothetical protein
MSAPLDPKVESEIPSKDEGPKLVESETKLVNPPAGEEKKEEGAAPVCHYFL